MHPRIGNPVYEARLRAGFGSVQDAARWLGIHPVTLHRQELWISRPARPVVLALELFGGWPESISPHWQGWRLRPDGLFHGPGLRRSLKPGEILALPYLYGQIAALQIRLRAMERQKRLLTAANDPGITITPVM